MLSYDEYLILVDEVNRLRNEVHIFNVEEVSEAALDDLKHKITLYETTNPDKISQKSPNYTIAGGVAEKFVKSRHTRRMLSLNDIFDQKELADWQQRWIDYGAKNEIFTTEDDDQTIVHNENKASISYVCEPKIDGLAISIVYNDGEIVRATTRGDGWTGELVTDNIKQIQAIPKYIDFKGSMEVRGEVFLAKNDFEELNKAIASGQKVGRGGQIGPEAVFANPRNAASGTIRQLDSRVVGERNLSFIAYGCWIDELKE